MEQTAKVRNINADGTAQLLVLRESACSGDCHKCSGCGAVKESLLIDAVNSIGATPGDMVVVKSESGPVLKGAAMLYMVPLLLFFLGYYLGSLLGSGALGGCVGFLAGIALATLYDRKVLSKKKTVYTITGYARIKGDNHVD